MKGAAARRTDMAKRRKERQRYIPDPPAPPPPPKGKRGNAAKTVIPRTKEPLKATRKVKG